MKRMVIRINLQMVVCSLLLLFFGTMVIISIFQRSIFEGFTKDVKSADVSKGNSAIDSSYVDLLQGLKDNYNGPSDENPQKLTSSQKDSGVSQSDFVAKQKQEEAVAARERNQQKQQSGVTAPASTGASTSASASTGASTGAGASASTGASAGASTGAVEVQTGQVTSSGSNSNIQVYTKF